MTLLDTNMILRYLLNDNQEMADIAEEYLNSGDASVTTEVVAEVVYVLKGVYSTERDLVSVVVKDFLKLVSCRETSFFRLLHLYQTQYLSLSVNLQARRPQR